jgi:hypothetical protein
MTSDANAKKYPSLYVRFLFLPFLRSAPGRVLTRLFALRRRSMARR